MKEKNSFRIKGGKKISGTFTPRGNKNASLPIIAASLLTDKEVIINNVPRIHDVQFMLELIGIIGVDWSWLDNNKIRIKAENIKTTTLDTFICSKIRASILLAGPLLSRCGNVKVPPPGGDVIGRRRLDTHFQAFKAMGVKCELDGNYYSLSTSNSLHGANIFLDEPSVTGTENTLMAAALIPEEIKIRNAASEPHIQDLCMMLKKMGTRIKGIGTNYLEIEGTSKLSGTEIDISSDHIEIASLVAMAAITGGKLKIENVDKKYLYPILINLKRLGIDVSITENVLVVDENQILEIQADFQDAIPTISDGPWPGFPADLTSIALVVATQARGTVLIFEKMFESRMFFVDKLISMGAKIVLCDPHRAVVIGPSELRAQHLSSPDIRAGMALLTAASVAQGTSIIDNAHQIDRGYENLDIRLSELGLEIERI